MMSHDTDEQENNTAIAILQLQYDMFIYPALLAGFLAFQCFWTFSATPLSLPVATLVAVGISLLRCTLFFRGSPSCQELHRGEESRGSREDEQNVVQPGDGDGEVVPEAFARSSFPEPSLGESQTPCGLKRMRRWSYNPGPTYCLVWIQLIKPVNMGPFDEDLTGKLSRHPFLCTRTNLRMHKNLTLFTPRSHSQLTWRTSSRIKLTGPLRPNLRAELWGAPTVRASLSTARPSSPSVSLHPGQPLHQSGPGSHPPRHFCAWRFCFTCSILSASCAAGKLTAEKPSRGGDEPGDG